MSLCRCGLTKDDVQEYHRDDSVPMIGGRCQNPRADESPGVCGMALGAHPTVGKNLFRVVKVVG